jgi:citrate lyase synthetase
MAQIYCVKCRKFTGSESISQVTTKNNRQMLKAVCIFCGKIKCKILGKNI